MYFEPKRGSKATYTDAKDFHDLWECPKGLQNKEGVLLGEVREIVLGAA